MAVLVHRSKDHPDSVVVTFDAVQDATTYVLRACDVSPHHRFEDRVKSYEAGAGGQRHAVLLDGLSQRTYELSITAFRGTERALHALVAADSLAVKNANRFDHNEISHLTAWALQMRGYAERRHDRLFPTDSGRNAATAAINIDGP